MGNLIFMRALLKSLVFGEFVFIPLEKNMAHQRPS